MLEIHLIRHAKSSWKDADTPDFDRPLSPRGVRDAQRMAHLLAGSVDRPIYLISSPARRTRPTAIAFAREFQVPDSFIDFRPSIYEATADRLFSLLKEFSDDKARVLLVGHNPGISELARLLTRSPLTELPTCGIATISLPCKRWRDVRSGSGKLTACRLPSQS